MTPDHDDTMIAHARRRGPVTVTEGDRLVVAGILVAWRPTITRPGEHGDILTGSRYVARVLLPTGATRTYPLNRYTVTATQ